jgi:hypothetical protein
MAYARPIHSARETDNKVYHNNDQCAERNNIEETDVRPGTGGLPMCDNCNRLNSQDT